MAVLVVVVTIYVTLGLAGTLASSFSEPSLNAATFVLGGLLILAALITQSVERSLGPFELFVAVGVLAVFVLVVTRLTSPVERSHLMEYGVVAILIYQALRERADNGQRVPRPVLLAIGMTAVVGTVDELIQAPLPNRVFDPADIWFNIGAAVMGVLGGLALTWARSRPSTTS